MRISEENVGVAESRLSVDNQPGQLQTQINGDPNNNSIADSASELISKKINY